MLSGPDTYQVGTSEEVIPTVIIDNFFETPSLVAKYARDQEYMKCTEHPAGGTWPGKRTQLLDKLDPVLHEMVCRKLIRYLPHHMGFELADMTFHISTEETKEGWIHTDPPHLGIGVVIYLNDGIRDNTGTKLYDVPPGYAGQMYEDEFKSQMAATEQENIDEYNAVRDQCNKDFRMSITCEERFNRCIIFDGRKYHGAAGLYGDNPENGRLTLVCFLRGVLK